MKKSLLFLVFAMLISFTVLGQKFPNVDKSPHDIALFRAEDESLIKVVYGRPMKNDRDIFGALVPYGKVWRTGANEATEVTFYKDATINGTSVPAGTYSLFTVPNEGKWEVIFNSDLNQWGAYNHDASKDVAKVEVDTQKTSATVEAFAITFNEAEGGADMILAWDDTMVAVPVKM